MFFLPTWLLHTAKCFTKQKRKSYSHGFRALSKFHVSTVLWKINFSPIPFIYLRPTHSTRKKNMIRSNVVNLFRNALLNILYTVSEQVFNCVCDKFFFCWPVRSFAKQRTGLLYGAVVYKYISLSTFHFIPPALGRKFRFSTIAIFC